MIVANYTADDKSKAIKHDNYVDDIKKSQNENCTNCGICIYCGKNKCLPVMAKHLLCAKYIDEIAIVKESGTCDSARSYLKWYNFVGPLKKLLLKRSGFDLKAR